MRALTFLFALLMTGVTSAQVGPPSGNTCAWDVRPEMWCRKHLTLSGSSQVFDTFDYSYYKKFTSNSCDVRYTRTFYDKDNAFITQNQTVETPIIGDWQHVTGGEVGSYIPPMDSFDMNWHCAAAGHSKATAFSSLYPHWWGSPSWTSMDVACVCTSLVSYDIWYPVFGKAEIQVETFAPVYWLIPTTTAFYDKRLLLLSTAADPDPNLTYDKSWWALNVDRVLFSMRVPNVSEGEHQWSTPFIMDPWNLRRGKRIITRHVSGESLPVHRYCWAIATFPPGNMRREPILHAVSQSWTLSGGFW